MAEEITLKEAAKRLGITSGALRRAAAGEHKCLDTRVEDTPRGPFHWVTPDEVERYRSENLGRVGRPRTRQEGT